MVTVKEVAAAAAVSVGTVSNVLNRPEMVSKETADRVLEAIDRLGFVRNDGARQLRIGHSGSIGLIVPDLRNPFFAEIAQAAEARASQEGLSVLVADSASDPGREARHLDLFEEQRAFGILIAPVAESLNGALPLIHRGLRTVLVDYTDETLPISSVSVDDTEGGRLAARHLLEIGCQRIAFVGGRLQIRQVRERLAGAEQAVAAAGATLEWISTDALTTSAGRDVGEAIMARAVADRPDAVFAANDLVARGVVESFAIAGKVRVPEDIAVIGYDDIDFAASSVVPLSSVRQPAALLGSTAVDILLDSTEVIHKSFRPSLVVRSSTVVTKA